MKILTSLWLTSIFYCFTHIPWTLPLNIPVLFSQSIYPQINVIKGGKFIEKILQKPHDSAHYFLVLFPSCPFASKAEGRGFQQVPRDLANGTVFENNVGSMLLHNFNDNVL